jgi:hypothetical protein
VRSNDNSAQFAPWKHEEAIRAARVGWRELDHHTDEIRIRIVELTHDDLLWTIKHDVRELTEIQLPTTGSYGLDLNQRVPSFLIDRDNVIERHVAGERRGYKTTSRQLGRDDVFAGLLSQVVASSSRHCRMRRPANGPGIELPAAGEGTKPDPWSPASRPGRW